MKRNLLLITLIVAFVFAHPWETQAKDKSCPWGEKLWEQFEAGEIQFAITVNADIPMDWTREMIIDWLELGWLVIEKATVGDMQGGDCHLVVRYDSTWCVEGPGPRRCCCSYDVQY